jgi:hypothetical protein
VPISNELFVFDLQAHTDSGRMVDNPYLIALRQSCPLTRAPWLKVQGNEIFGRF